MKDKISIFSYGVTLDGSFYLREYSAIKGTWIHVALVYKGPENEQGISVYHNGELQGNDKWAHNAYNQAAPSVVLKIGKLFEKTTEAGYGKLIMDELFIWNKQLSLAEIQAVMSIAD